MPVRETQITVATNCLFAAVERLDKASLNLQDRFGAVLRCDPPCPVNGQGMSALEKDSGVRLCNQLSEIVTRINQRAGFLEGLAERCEL